MATGSGPFRLVFHSASEVSVTLPSLSSVHHETVPVVSTSVRVLTTHCLLVVTIYFSANAYIIDAFPGYVASALAAKTVVRSGSGAAMPLFITAMFHNLGNGWAASTWAFISLAMVRYHVLPDAATSANARAY